MYVDTICLLVVYFCLFSAQELNDLDHLELEDHYYKKVDDRNNIENTAEFWNDAAQDAIENQKKKVNKKIAKNVILFLGDGMSIPTLTTSRIFMGQTMGMTGEETVMSFEKFPITGLAKTYCVNAQVPDSACTATSYLCGVKANKGTVGVSGAVTIRNCSESLIAANRLESIAKWAIDAGKDAGIVTTARVTHASPAGTYAKSAHRVWEYDTVMPDNAKHCRDIAVQLVREQPGRDFKVILGGGRSRFFPNFENDLEYPDLKGRRTDGKNLVKYWMYDKILKNATHEFVWTRNQLLKLDVANTDYLLGLFEPGHMHYYLEANKTTEPTLAEMTAKAIKMLSKNKKGYFLFVEAGRIDHAHHHAKAHLALSETVELSKAVEKAVAMTNVDDTLIVVTSDHAHVMSFNGYSQRGKSITGPSDGIGKDGVPYMTMSYTNGPGHRDQVNLNGRLVRQDVTKLDYMKPNFAYTSEIGLASETHGGDDVAIFARGPHQHMFTGLYEQNHIPHYMAYASCIGKGKTACCGDKPRYLCYDLPNHYTSLLNKARLKYKFAP